MLCEKCGKKEATVHVVCVVQNKQIDKWLCDDCAKAFAPQGMAGGGVGENGSVREFLEELLKPLGKLVPVPAGTRATDSEYTLAAANILAAAKRTAGQRRHESIGTEHILWSIFHMEHSYAFDLLNRCGLEKYALLGELETWMSKPTDGAKPEQYSPRAKLALDYAKNFTQMDLLSKISSAHILLGIVAEGEGVGSRVLHHFNITVERLQDMMHQDFIETKTLPEGNKFKAEAEKEREEANIKKALQLLDGFGRNLNDLAKEGKLDPVVGRDEEIEHLTRVLCRRTKNNPVLIGEAGVGKTAVAEGLAQRIVSKQAPELLQDKIVFSLELGYVVAGAKYRGELEERLRDIIEAVRHSPRILLFIDELQMIMNGGDGMMSIANIIKPALARGDLHVIGATTLEDYRKSIDKDAALERRFQPIIIKAPDVANALRIMEGVKRRYEEYHQVAITPEALEAAVKLSDRYLSDRNLPDKAIDILDEACSAVRLAAAKDYTGDEAKPTVNEASVRQVISQWTNIPLERLDAAESKNLLSLEQVLHQRVVGQDEAIRAVAQAVRRSRAGLKDKNRPVGSFLFLGPTGVGKTELAKALAENLFGDERSLVRFDMSEFMEKHTASRLIGAPPGYVGYEDGGRLTSVIRRRPYAVILLDEIEKAHPDIFNLLLQIMEDGRLTDGQGRTVDFRNTVLIMTSNACAEKLSGGRALGFAANEAAATGAKKQAVLEEIKQVFKPEFLNRIDETVVFDMLGKKELAGIVDNMLLELQGRLEEAGLSLSATPAAKDKLLNVGMDVRYGARPLRRALRRYVEDRLADLYLAGTFKKGDQVLLDVLDNEFCFTKVQPAVDLKPETVAVEEEARYGQSEG